MLSDQLMYKSHFPILKSKSHIRFLVVSLVCVIFKSRITTHYKERSYTKLDSLRKSAGK